MDRNIYFLLVFLSFTLKSMQQCSRPDISAELAEHGKYVMTPPRPNKKKKADHFYEPYWEKGDWVFYRKSSTASPNAFYLNKDPDHRACDQVCTSIYTDYRLVCGMRLKYSDWTYEFKPFDNLCYLELENCQSKTQRYAWFPVKKENCTDTITSHGTDATDIASRVVIWERLFPRK